MQSGSCQIIQPGFPDQADHSLTIVWRHTNHTKFRIRSCHDQLGNHIWSRDHGQPGIIHLYDPNNGQPEVMNGPDYG